LASAAKSQTKDHHKNGWPNEDVDIHFMCPPSLLCEPLQHGSTITTDSILFYSLPMLDRERSEHRARRHAAWPLVPARSATLFQGRFERASRMRTVAAPTLISIVAGSSAGAGRVSGTAGATSSTAGANIGGSGVSIRAMDSCGTAASSRIAARA